MSVKITYLHIIKLFSTSFPPAEIKTLVMGISRARTIRSCKDNYVEFFAHYEKTELAPTSSLWKDGTRTY